MKEKQLVKSIEASKKRIAAERDKLRSLTEEVDDLEESCNKALDDLESAVESLSELV